MAKAPKVVIVGGYKFHLFNYEARRAVKIFAELQQTVLIPVSKGVDVKAFVGNFQDGAMLGAALLPAIGEISSQFGPEKLDNLMKLILTADDIYIEIDGQLMRFDAFGEAQAGLTAMQTIELMIRMVEHNFSDFLELFRSRFGEALGKMMVKAHAPAGSAKISRKSS